MPKQLYLTMCIGSQLKSELRRRASEEGRNMSDFVTKVLEELLAPARKGRTNQSSRSGVGRTYFMMRINEELKTKLERLAARDYRTLTDFVEILLREMTDPRQVLTVTQRRSPMILPSEPRRARIAISVTPELKAVLQQLANKDYRTLANFIELKLHQTVDALFKGAAFPPRRQARHDRLTVRISTEAKIRLQMLADLEHRTITDFVELRLRKAIAIQRHIRLKSPRSTR